MIYNTRIAIDNAKYTNTAVTSVVLLTSVAANVLQCLSIWKDFPLLSLLKVKRKVLEESSLLEEGSHIQKLPIKVLETWEMVYAGACFGSVILAFALFICIVVQANIKVTITITFLVLGCSTVNPCLNLMFGNPLEFSKSFVFFQVLLVTLLWTFSISSLFQNRWPMLIVAGGLLGYILLIIRWGEEGRWSTLAKLNLTMFGKHIWYEKYEHLIDTANIAFQIFVFTMFTIYLPQINFWYSSGSTNTPLQVSLPVSKYFYFKDGITKHTDTLNFDKSNYMLFIGTDNKVSLFTPTIPTGTVVGAFINDKIILRISSNVGIGISTYFDGSRWFSIITDNTIKFAGGIIGPKNQVLLQFVKNSISTFITEEGTCPLPSAEYVFDSELSTLATSSTPNRVLLRVDNSADNSPQIFTIYYPSKDSKGEDIAIGELGDDGFIYLNLESSINGLPIFKVDKTCLMYLSPIDHTYVYVDTLDNLYASEILFYP